MVFFRALLRTKNTHLFPPATINLYSPSVQTEDVNHIFIEAGPQRLNFSGHVCGSNSTPAVSVVPFRSNTFSPLKSPSSVRVKSGQVHIFQLRYLKRCGSSAK